MRCVDHLCVCNYDVIMKAQIIQIGNSQGLRIPKILLEETGISGEVELESVENGILIRNLQTPRGSWDESFKALADIDDDVVSDPSFDSVFDRKDWKW